MVKFNINVEAILKMKAQVLQSILLDVEAYKKKSRHI